MTQAEARRVAKELGGVANHARKSPKGHWIVGGWTTPKDVWVVTDTRMTVVLAS